MCTCASGLFSDAELTWICAPHSPYQLEPNQLACIAKRYTQATGSGQAGVHYMGATTDSQQPDVWLHGYNEDPIGYNEDPMKHLLHL